MGNFLVGATGTGNAYSAQNADLQYQDVTPAIQQAGQQFNNAYDAQTGLAGQLQAQASGVGPNPAQTMLNQATNRNIQQNAGLIASQKGINPALAQREAAQNAASTGQQAAGQGALMQAQQQQQALGGLANVYGQQQQGALGMQGTLQNAFAAQNNAKVSNAAQMNSANGAVAQQNATQAGNLFGQAAGGLSSALGSFFSKGGVVQPKGYAGGGMIDMPANIMGGGGYSGAPASYGGAGVQYDPNQAKSAGQGVGAYLKSAFSPVGESGGAYNAVAGGDSLGVGSLAPEAASGAPSMLGLGTLGGEGAAAAAPSLLEMAPLAAALNKGGKVYSHPVPAHLAALSQIFHPHMSCGGMLKAQGGSVPGKPKVSGDSPKNDTVPTMLSPGEIVIPNHITEAGDKAPEMAAQFVADKLREQSPEHKDFKDALKKAIGSRGKK